MVYILLAEGFEEAEALVPADLLRRSGAQVSLTGVAGQTVVGAHGISVNCDLTVDQVKREDMELLVLPGGLPGVTNIADSAAAVELIRFAVDNGRYLAAICAAPSMLLGPMGILNGRKATCYPGTEGTMEGADAQKGQSVVADGTFVTGEGPGAAFEFGLKLVEVLKGADAAKQVGSDACWRH